MGSEPSALAASGASTLVSLMVTDSWVRARDLLGHLLARTGSGPGVLAALDEARSHLLSATGSPQEERCRAAVRSECRARLQHLTTAELHTLITALHIPAPHTVHNRVDGGIHHAPVIQSGHITDLTLHTPDQPGP
ncbi:hypothetical protein [Streptomyces sp. NPDC058045]|uniref:hypothetical protein n=1 Tax=Streptomyces sp. NPDC058045 TaxID=3346311 RepID=UPI0036EFE877